jgi:hypothetical protein
MNPGQMRQADGSKLLFEITARDTCGPHGGHSVDRASSLLYEITRRVQSRRGLNTTYALQPIYPEEHCPQSTSLWQLNSYRLLWLELMCRPLTRRGGHTATTKETERTPPPGGPAGAMRRNARERRREFSRRAGMIDAAHRWKARAKAGCAQAPTLKPQAGPPAHHQHGMTKEIQRTRREGPVQIYRRDHARSPR